SSEGSSLRVTEIFDLPRTGTSCERYPVKETTRITLSAISGNENKPFRSVCVPTLVPLTITEAPGSGVPVESVTVPRTAFCRGRAGFFPSTAFSAVAMLATQQSNRHTAHLYDGIQAGNASRKHL